MIAYRDFATRLRLARELLARGPAPMPVHLADQFEAASAEVREAHARLGALLPLLHPERTWRQRVEPCASDDVRAYLLAVVLDCSAVCCHLKRGGPQPAFVRLPLRRADCVRCVRTLRRPPPDESDRCDVCGARGVLMFVPFGVRQGPAIIAGDACRSCASVLGIVQEESA